MSLTQIQHLVTVAEEGNVTQAAKRLRASQPSLARRMVTLEDALAALLPVCARRGARLLRAGPRLLRRARTTRAMVAEAAGEFVCARADGEGA